MAKERLLTVSCGIVRESCSTLLGTWTIPTFHRDWYSSRKRYMIPALMATLCILLYFDPFIYLSIYLYADQHHYDLCLDLGDLFRPVRILAATNKANQSPGTDAKQNGTYYSKEYFSCITNSCFQLDPRTCARVETGWSGCIAATIATASLARSNRVAWLTRSMLNGVVVVPCSSYPWITNRDRATWVFRGNKSAATSFG